MFTPSRNMEIKQIFRATDTRFVIIRKTNKGVIVIFTNSIRNKWLKDTDNVYRNINNSPVENLLDAKKEETFNLVTIKTK